MFDLHSRKPEIVGHVQQPADVLSAFTAPTPWNFVPYTVDVLDCPVVGCGRSFMKDADWRRSTTDGCVRRGGAFGSMYLLLSK